MGVRFTINRILCTPCNLLIKIKDKMKKSNISGKSNSTKIAAFAAGALIILLLVIWISPFSSNYFLCCSMSRNVDKSGVFSPVDESFMRLYSGKVGKRDAGMKIEAKNEDEFSSSNFLNQKLRRLIALTCISTPLKLSVDESKLNFTFLLNELNIALKVHNFYQRQWGCPEISPLSLPSAVQRTKHTTSGDVVHNGRNVALQMSQADLDEMISGKCGSTDSDNTRDDENRCFLLKNRKLLQQYLFMQELSHSSIVKPYGVCLDVGSESKPGSLVLAKETGLPVNMEKLQEQSWNLRLRIALDMANLAVYLSDNSLGGIILESWEPENFIITQDGTSILVKLTNFDQNIVFVEKQCNYDQECAIGGISLPGDCVQGVCQNFNDLTNVHNLCKSFLSPLLEVKLPAHTSEETSELFKKLQNPRLSSSSLSKLLLSLQVSAEDVEAESPNGNSQLREALKNHHDGAQVDSWEQHESHIAINEVDINQLQNELNNNKDEVVPDKIVQQTEEDEYKDTFGYKKIENADYPGRYDYYCQRSKAEWGCVVSLRKLEDAAKKCDDDPKCKAFVTMPHLRKEGWIIVILKSDNTRAVDHAGTTVYIKVSEEDKSKSSKDTGDSSKMDGVAKLCLQELLQTQEPARETRERNLMEVCNWAGMSDSKWQSVVLEATVNDATKFKPSRGKMAVGGQMDVTLDSSSRPSPALFLAKNGPDEFHLAQLAAYHLDRMLGLYKILPAFLRTLTETEMADAGFPVDIGGNQFDVFRHLKNADKSLAGTIVPMISGRTGVEHYISVPKLGQITNAVTPFSKRQWNDLEYLLLMWLASLPMPTKGHRSLQGHLIHIKADEAFQSEPSKEVLSYFYNCQFPRIAIDVLRNLRTAHCNFGDQLIARVRTVYPDLPVSAFSFKVPVADITTRNANRLLEVVDSCVKKFGDNKVLYDS